MLVKFFATFRDIAGCRTTELPAPADVLSLLTHLESAFHLRGRLLASDGKGLGPDVIVLVNGRHVQHLAGAATPLTDKDIVAVFPVIAGG